MKVFTKRRIYSILKILLLILIAFFYCILLLKASMVTMEQAKPKVTKIYLSHKKQNVENIHDQHLKIFQSIQLNNSHQIRSSSLVKKSTNDLITLNPIYEYSEEINSAAEKEFAERRTTLWNTCVEKKIVGKYPPNAWEFFISPGHGLTWCNVFKAASSTWMYYFNILGGYNLSFLQRTRSSPLELARSKFPRPSFSDLNDALTNSISFLTVREPFERLLSAYRNKLEGCRNKYYKILGKQIVQKFRKKIKNLNQTTSPGPTFEEFLLFLINQNKIGKHFDEHWSPIYRFCTPCSINFTLIAKVETFQRDTEYIIRQTGLETLLLNKLPQTKSKYISNRGTSDTKILIPKYFSQIDENLLREILKVYELDFLLFGYNSSKYYDFVQPSVSDTTLLYSTDNSLVTNKKN